MQMPLLLCTVTIATKGGPIKHFQQAIVAGGRDCLLVVIISIGVVACPSHTLHFQYFATAPPPPPPPPPCEIYYLKIPELYWRKQEKEIIVHTIIFKLVLYIGLTMQTKIIGYFTILITTRII